MAESYRFRVTGRVQGVFFRQATAETARRLGIDGWVMNCADGSVEGYAAGAAEALAALREWLRRGPPAACVERLDWMPDQQPVASGFSVRR